MRISKYIARTGLCSRREAEKLVSNGDIKVNQIVTKDLSTKIQDEDVVTYQGKTLTAKATELYAFHKPKGYVVTNSDEQNRQTIYDLLPEKYHNLKYIGRLDKNSEGLLLLTNDGELKRFYELPKNKIKRIYLVRLFGKLTQQDKKLVLKGINIDGIKYQIVAIENHKIANNSWYKITLEEGKNREIRRIFEYLEHPVSRIIRLQYGKYKLGEMRKGNITKVEYNNE